MEVETERSPDGRFCVRASGVLDALGADRLLYVVQHLAPSEFDMDMSEVERTTPTGVAAVTTYIRQWLAAGKRPRLHGLPQTLAHTLYKLGVVAAAPQTVVSVQTEEPYAG